MDSVPKEQQSQPPEEESQGLRERIWHKRVDAQRERATYAELRDAYLKSRASFAKFLGSPIAVDDLQYALQNTYKELHGGAAQLDMQEERIKVIEKDLSLLEYWQGQVEVRWYDSIQANEQTNKGDVSIETEEVASSEWMSSTTTTSLSPLAQLNRKLEAVGFLEERLAELDYEHTMELGFLDGEDAHKLNEQLVEEYEQDRADLVVELVKVKDEARKLEQDLHGSQPMPPLAGMPPLAVNGGMTKFPGTCNTPLGLGIPHNNIATGFVRSQERAERWQLDLPMRSSQMKEEKLATVGRATSHGLEALVGQATDANEFRRNHPLNAEIDGERARGRHKLSMWYGDAPLNRYSDSFLRRGYFATASNATKEKRRLSNA